jgi:catechol-2,3-dioxygenase
MPRPAPLKLGHLVLKVRDVAASAAFYQEIVGLEVSDWIDDRMVFMRAGTDHHDLALLQMTDDEIAKSHLAPSRVEHFSYQLADLAAMRGALALLQEKGIAIDRGIGKHGPGDNLFLVFHDPDGNLVEFYADMVRIDSEHPYEGKVWEGRILETFDQWRLAEFVVPPPARIVKLLPEGAKK